MPPISWAEIWDETSFRLHAAALKAAEQETSVAIRRLPYREYWHHIRRGFTGTSPALNTLCVAICRDVLQYEPK